MSNPPINGRLRSPPHRTPCSGSPLGHCGSSGLRRGQISDRSCSVEKRARRHCSTPEVAGRPSLYQRRVARTARPRTSFESMVYVALGAQRACHFLDYLRFTRGPPPRPPSFTGGRLPGSLLWSHDWRRNRELAGRQHASPQKPPSPRLTHRLPPFRERRPACGGWVRSIQPGIRGWPRPVHLLQGRAPRCLGRSQSRYGRRGQFPHGTAGCLPRVAP